MYLPAVSDTQATLLPSQKGMCNCCGKNALHLLLFGSGGHQSPAAKSPFVICQSASGQSSSVISSVTTVSQWIFCMIFQHGWLQKYLWRSSDWHTFESKVGRRLLLEHSVSLGYIPPQKVQHEDAVRSKKLRWLCCSYLEEQQNCWLYTMENFPSLLVLPTEDLWQWDNVYHQWQLMIWCWGERNWPFHMSTSLGEKKHFDRLMTLLS